MMYFGTRERMRWLAAPAPGAGMSAFGFSESIEYANGGIGFRNSKGAHMEYEFTWNSLTRDEIAQYEAYQFGLYGDGLIHFLDPVAMDRNLFSAQWAAPKLTAEDGIPLTGVGRPERVLIGDLSYDYPMYGARYEVTAGQTGLTFHCPIPSNYTAWLGAHGVAGDQGLLVRPTLGGIPTGASTQVPVTGVNSATWWSHSFSAGAINGIDISIDTTDDATITLAGLMLQVLPTGDLPQAGEFIGGRGHSGCVFDGKLSTSVYSIPFESIGMTGKLVEVGDWL